MRTLIYGSFDPFTYGHAFLCRKARPHDSDEVVIAVLSDPSKSYCLSEEERRDSVKRGLLQDEVPSDLAWVSLLPSKDDPIVHLIHHKCDRILRMFRPGEQSMEVRRQLYHQSRYPGLQYDLEESVVTVSSTFVRDAVGAGGWVSERICHPTTQVLLRERIRGERRIGVVGEKSDFLDYVQGVWRRLAEKNLSRSPAIRAVFLPDTNNFPWAAAQTNWGRGYNFIHIPPNWTAREDIAGLAGWCVVNLLPTPLPENLSPYAEGVDSDRSIKGIR